MAMNQAESLEARGHDREQSADVVIGDEPSRGVLSGQPILLSSYVLLTIAVILFAAATVYGFNRLRQQTELAQYNSQAALWLVVSFEREYMKLDNLLWRYLAGDPALSADALLTQYDVLWSRIGLMREGGHSRPLQQVGSYSSVVPIVDRLIRRHEPAVFGAVSAGMPLPREFVEEYRAMADSIHRFMVDTHINRSWIAEVKEAQIKDTRFAIYMTLAGTLISTLLLFAIVIVQLKERHGILVRTVRALEQSEQDRNALHDEVRRRKQVEKERQALLLDLEARNEELESYAYTISHDLKSPLYTIQGFTGFLRSDIEEGSRDRVLDDIDRIRQAVLTMDNLLDDILRLSRVNLGEESRQLVALDGIVADALALVSGEIEECGVQVRLSGDLPEVYGETRRLTEIFQNLVSNAVKFLGDEANPVIEIGARIDGEWVICHVEDNGIGIAPEFRDRVFNLFERLNSETSGTGVGLAIVKRIVERHGGKIWILSGAVGKGSRFEFTLPATPQG